MQYIPVKSCKECPKALSEEKAFLDCSPRINKVFPPKRCPLPKLPEVGNVFKPKKINVGEVNSGSVITFRAEDVGKDCDILVDIDSDKGEQYYGMAIGGSLGRFSILVFDKQTKSINQVFSCKGYKPNVIVNATPEEVLKIFN